MRRVVFILLPRSYVLKRPLEVRYGGIAIVGLRLGDGILVGEIRDLEAVFRDEGGSRE